MPERDNFSWALMITCYTRQGKLEKARELLELVPDKLDTACWNTMIAGYAKKGQFNDAEKVFEEMPVKDLVSYNSMLAGYTQNGKMSLVMRFCERMVERNIVSWNSLITGFLQNSLYLDALRSSVLMGQEGKKPEQSTFARSLSACANLAALQVGKQLHEFILKSGYINILFVSNALIAMYAKCGTVESNEKMFKDIDCVDLISWNSLILGYALNGYANEAFLGL